MLNKLGIKFLVALFFGTVVSLGCAEHQDPHAGHGHEGNSCGGDETHDEGEMAISLSKADIADSEIRLAKLTGGTLKETRVFPGEVLINEDRKAIVTPKAEGIVRSVLKSVGDSVQKNEVMAILESTARAEVVAEYLGAVEALALAKEVYEREKKLHSRKVSSEQEMLEARMAYREAKLHESVSKRALVILGITAADAIRLSAQEGYDFARLEVRAPISGVVISRDIVQGAVLAVGDAPFVIAELSTVWVDLATSVQDAALIEAGMPVVVEGATGVVANIAPTINHQTRKRMIRVIVENSTGHFVPGTYTKGRVTLSETEVKMLVPKSAIHYMELEAILFVKDSDGFETRVVELGRSSSTMSELLGGNIKLGDEYVTRGGFAIKAKILTSDMDPHAGHGH